MSFNFFNKKEGEDLPVQAPLGVKLIAFVYVLVAVSVLIEFNSPSLKHAPLLVGNYFLPPGLTLAFLTGQTVITLVFAWGLLTLRKPIWYGVMVYKALGIGILLITLALITPQTLQEMVERLNVKDVKLTVGLYRLATLPSILLELYIMSYLYKKKDIFF